MPKPFRRRLAASLSFLTLTVLAGPLLCGGGQVRAEDPLSMPASPGDDQSAGPPMVDPLSAEAPGDSIYLCPMHPKIISREPGRCPICGMDLVPRPAEGATGGPGVRPVHQTTHQPAPAPAPEHSALPPAPLYICPMHSQVTSGAPGRCPICGMDLVPKPSGDAATTPPSVPEPPPGQAHHHVEESAAVILTDAVVNQLGVRTAAVRHGTLARHIEGSGVFLRSTARAYRPGSPGAEPGAGDPGAGASTLMVVGQVFESQAPLVHQGQSARVRFPSLGAKEWTGTVTSLESQISQTTHTLPFRVSVDHEGATIPGGMSAIVTLVVDPVADVLLVPREAVILTGQGARVVVAQDGGRFQPREVQAEDLGEEEIVIHSGLQEGERVVVSAQFLLDSEADLQTGLRRLGGGQPGAQVAPRGAAQ